MTLFTPATFDFLSDLAAHNSKAWFQDNRDRYDAHWKAPAIAFINAIAPRMEALEPALKADPKINGSLRRINRDVRFSKDKSPYTPALHLVFWAGDHPNRSPGVHLVLTPDGVGYGTGLYGLGPEMLKRFRDAVSDKVEQKALFKALDVAEADGCTLGDPDLARLPKGFDAEGRAAVLLRHKSIVARTHDAGAPPKSIQGTAGLDWAMARALAMLPLIRWLSIL
ncbi:MAG: DUF2461 domain-containing protein [Pseudomonadota bacterium]